MQKPIRSACNTPNTVEHTFEFLSQDQLLDMFAEIERDTRCWHFSNCGKIVNTYEMWEELDSFVRWGWPVYVTFERFRHGNCEYWKCLEVATVATTGRFLRRMQA